MLRGLTKEESLGLLDIWEEAVKSENIYGFGLSKLLFFNAPIFKLYDESFSLKGIFDNNAAIDGQKLLGFDIMSPDKVADQLGNGRLVVFAGDYPAIRRQLEGYGLKEKTDFISVFDFWPLYCYYKYNRLFLCRDIFGFTLTDRCNLRCQGCISHMTDLEYYKGDIPLEALTADLDTLFTFVDQVNQISISGGETLLYKEFPAFLDAVGQRYRHRINRINFNTNGTIAPEQPLLERIKKYDISVRISDYSNCGIPGYEEKMHNTVELFRKKGINPKLTSQPWVELDLTPEQSAHLRAAGPETLKRHYTTCTRRHYKVVNGQLYSCPSAYLKMQRFGLPPDHPEIDRLDLREMDPFDPEDKKLLLMYLMSYNRNGQWLSCCETCTGMNPETETFPFPVVHIPRAIQAS